jgi:hypothetical protein
VDEKDNRVQFRADEQLLAALAAMADTAEEPLGVHAREALERYFSLIEQELGELDLSEAEASLIVDALNGIYIEPHTVRLLRATVLDAMDIDHLDQKWGVDREALLAKLRSYCPGKLFALLHGVERFWNSCSALPMSEGLRKAGLVRRGTTKQDS